MQHHLSVDIESYSSVDLPRCGLYRYVQSEDFQIMLFAYSWDGGPVTVIDLFQQALPADIVAALADPAVIKHAYNASFEWYCLNKFFYTPISSWRCTMLHGLYCGYPMGLGNLGAAMGLPQDLRKLGTGKSLISTFCKPCKPTRANGNRTRTLPHHEPEKWQLFKEYCAQDVVAEMNIASRLAPFPVPENEQRLWELDQLMNAYGVAVDQEMVEGALYCSQTTNTALLQEAVRLSGLDNPNSTKQLKAWLEEELDEELGNLNKATIAGLLKREDTDEVVQRMLQIRKELAKTSVKKYDAMRDAVCADGRIRGMLQFYGANRTGRWCLTGDHEVLTTYGWARLDAWPGGEIACWNPTGETVSFQKAERVAFDYDGDLYEYSDKRIAQISTPDHKMYVKRRYGGDWTVDTVENMAAYRPSIPFTGFRFAPAGLDHSQLRVLVMVQADGHYTREGSVKLSFKKQRKVARCKELLRRAGIVYSVSEYKQGNDTRTTFQIYTRHVPLWLRMFQDKTFGPWLLDESPDVFFDELVYWDGYRSAVNSIQYSTCNKQNADMVQAFAHLSGRSALIKVKHRSDTNPEWRDAYYVDIWLTPINCHEVRPKPAVRHFTGAVYCAMTPTGYFLVRRNGRVWVTGNSGRIVQAQNLPQNHLDSLELPRSLVKQKNLPGLQMLYGNVPDTLSQLIRTAFVPSPGNKLLVADFNAIEARIIAWLSDEQWRQQVFATHGKIYEASASAMFGVPIEEITKTSPLRQKGKVAELALGYGGGPGALINMGALNMGLTEEELPEIVQRWRQANKRIKDFWYSMERAAVASVQTGQPQMLKHGISFLMEGHHATGQSFLVMQLPSGRKLYYAQPRLEDGAYGPRITYMGMDQRTKRWGRLDTYSGKLVENACQAIARDCLAWALQLIVAAGYAVIFHVHDEYVIDARPDQELQPVLDIMAQPIPWAPGLLLRGSGFETPYYCKD